MKIFSPTPYISYIAPKLTQGKVWYLSYYVQNPETGKMKRFRIKLDRYKTVKAKKEAARSISAHLTEKLALGWNPLFEDQAPKSGVRILDAMDQFLTIKKKEMEANSVRSYVSFVKILKIWLKSKGYPETMLVCSFSKSVAQNYMDDCEADPKISPRTYNNRLAFCSIMFNWFVERGYASENVFGHIRKKPKKLTEKNRTALTSPELATLISFLREDNPEYLAAVLLCYCCFMRPKEIVLLRCKDINLERQTVFVSKEIAKNDKNSTRTIPDAMMPYLRVLDLSNPDNYLFADNGKYDFKAGKKMLCSRKLAKYWSDRVRPQCDFPMEVQFYSLKDTGITKMLGDGVPVSFVKQQADHSSLAMTSIYLTNLKSEANEALRHADIIK